MHIGIELGWRAIRIVSVSDNGEVLSIPDFREPAVTTTAPILARSVESNGALVGSLGLDLAAEESEISGVAFSHALVDLDRAGTDPGAEAAFHGLAVLLEKIGRDIRSFGLSPKEASFVVSEDFLPRDQAATLAPALGNAAGMAGFAKGKIVYRDIVAALQGVNRLSPGDRTSYGREALPELRTIVVDAGFHSLRVSSVVVQADRIEKPVVSRAEKWNADFSSIERSMFGVFAKALEDDTGCKFSAAMMERAWTKLLEKDAPASFPAVDKSGAIHVLDLESHRQKILQEVTDKLSDLLAAAALPENSNFVFVIGPFASLPGIEENIRAVFDQRRRSGTYLCRFLPAHALAAGAGAEPSTPFEPSVTRCSKLEVLPINDGQSERFRGPKAPPLPPVAAPLSSSILQGAFGSLDFDELRNKPTFVEMGQTAGSFWASQIDRLLRLRSTAPTVVLKSYYDEFFRNSGIRDDSSVPGSAGGSVGLAQDNAYLGDATKAAIVKEVVNKLGTQEPAFEKAFRQGLADGFDKALTYRDGNKLVESPSTYFDRYCEDQQKAIVPESRQLTVVHDGEANVLAEPIGVLVRGRLLLSTPAMRATGSTSAIQRRHSLGPSSDGFRSVLATASVLGPRKTMLDRVRFLFGGETTTWQLVTIGALFVASAVLAGFALRGPPKPTVYQPASGEGSYTCGGLPPTAPTSFSCTTAKFPEISIGPDVASGSCYLAVMRLVLPTAAYITDYSALTLPAKELDAACAAQMPDVQKAFAAIDPSTAELVTSFGVKPLAKPKDLPAIQAPPAVQPPPQPLRELSRAWVRQVSLGGANVIDIAWPAYNPPRLQPPPTSNPPGAQPTDTSNPPGAPPTPTSSPTGIQPLLTSLTLALKDIVAADLPQFQQDFCFEIGVRLNVLKFAEGNDHLADDLSSILSDKPGEGLKFVRYQVGTKTDKQKRDQRLGEKQFKNFQLGPTLGDPLITALGRNKEVGSRLVGLCP